MRHIVGLNGQSGSGKSEAAKHLIETHGYTLIKFAGPLKAMLRAFYREVGLDDVEIERRIEGDLKEAPCKHLAGRTPRHAMETLGTEWGRQCMADHFWVSAWAAAVEARGTDVVVDDVRFNNEADAVRMVGGEVISLLPATRRRAKSTHVAEAGISPDLIDKTIKNDGTIHDLQVKLTKHIEPSFAETFGPLGG